MRFWWELLNSGKKKNLSKNFFLYKPGTGDTIVLRNIWHSKINLKIDLRKLFHLNSNLLRRLKPRKTGIRYFAGNKIFWSLAHNENFGLIWEIVVNFEYIFTQRRQNTSCEFESTRWKVANGNYLGGFCKKAIFKLLLANNIFH